jgi:hypothetical protein
MKVRKMCIISALAVIALAALAAHADVVRYEYMTIAGSTTTDGVRVLTDYVPKSNTVVRAMYSSSSAASSGASVRDVAFQAHEELSQRVRPFREADARHADSF